MSPVKALACTLGRRHWIVIALSALGGCGGGNSGQGGSSISGSRGSSSSPGSGSTTTGSGGAASGGTEVAGLPGTGGTGAGAQGSLPGTGGTGIFSQGSISAFGSVVLNGIHFDERGARIQIDGASSGSGALRLGMVAGIQGERYADGMTGRADSIEVWSIARGMVSATGSGGFTVLGMRIQVKASTFLEGVGSASAIAVGQWVAVWGLQADASGSAWVATRVAVVSAGGTLVATGTVAGSKDHRTLNGIALIGDDAEKLTLGRLTRVQGYQEIGSTELKVQSHYDINVRAESTSSPGEVELEGLVTALQSNKRFLLGSVQVDGSALPNYALVRVGAKLEVYGTWQGPVLKAREMEIEDD